MRKICLLTLLLLFIAVSAFAGFSGPGASGNVSSVQAALAAVDNASCTLEGSIIREVRPEHYIFKDDTGEIEIEIDDKVFMGRNVTPANRLRLIGQVDKEMLGTTIDVKQFEILR